MASKRDDSGPVDIALPPEVEAAATAWIAAKRTLETPAIKAAKSALERHEKVLKKFCSEKNCTSVTVDDGAVGYSSSCSTVLDMDLVRARLGESVTECEKQQQRQSLTLLG